MKRSSNTSYLLYKIFCKSSTNSARLNLGSNDNKKEKTTKTWTHKTAQSIEAEHLISGEKQPAVNNTPKKASYNKIIIKEGKIRHRKTSHVARTRKSLVVLTACE